MAIGLTREVGCALAKEPGANDVLAKDRFYLLGGCRRVLPNNKPCCLISHFNNVEQEGEPLPVGLDLGAVATFKISRDSPKQLVASLKCLAPGGLKESERTV
jgi:hypothetical protein